MACFTTTAVSKCVMLSIISLNQACEGSIEVESMLIFLREPSQTKFFRKIHRHDKLISSSQVNKDEAERPT